MSYVFSTSVAITTTSGGAATVYTGVITGHIQAIRYESTDTASTADLTITTKDTELSVLAVTNLATDANTTYYPRAVANTTAGVASGIAQELIPVSGEQIKAVMAQGGSKKSGTITYVIS